MLCKDRQGSRVVDAVWRTSQVSKKEEMAKVLLAHEEELNTDFYGSIVLRNCDIANFSKQQGAWLEHQRAAERTAERKKALFQDLLKEGHQDSASGSRGKGKRTFNDSSCDKELVTSTKIKKR